MERTKMDRPGWWFEADWHMEFEPEDPQAFGWQARRMKGFVNASVTGAKRTVDAVLGNESKGDGQ